MSQIFAQKLSTIIFSQSRNEYRINIVERFQGTPLFLCCDNTLTKNICALNNVIIFFSKKNPAFIKNAIILGDQMCS